MRSLCIVTTLFVGFAFAGCLGGEEGMDGQAFVDYEGSQAGTESDTVECDEDGQLTVTSTVQDGAFTVEVSDGSSTLHESTYEDDLDGDTASLDGEPGEWTLTVTREPGFNGSYAIQLGC